MDNFAEINATGIFLLIEENLQKRSHCSKTPKIHPDAFQHE